MDLGRILDGTPEPVLSVPDLILLDKDHLNNSGDYNLPVPMTEFQKELTDQVISAHYSDILKFFETDGPVMVESLHTLYINAQLVATHPFLLVDHYLPKNLLLKEVPLRLQQASGKFKVLGDILEIIKDRSSPLTIALVSRPGKSLDLIEAYILGKFVNYKRHSGSHLREPGEDNPKYSTIHLIPSSELDSTYLGGEERFDLILAFDQTFSINDPHISLIRTHNRVTPAPVIRFIPCNSIEHIYLKAKKPLIDSQNEIKTTIMDSHGHHHTKNMVTGSSNNTDATFLRRVLAAAVVLRGKVGLIPVDLRRIYSHGLKPLASWFDGSLDSPWMLPDISDIPEYTASDVEKSLLTEVYPGDDVFTNSSSIPVATATTAASPGGSTIIKSEKSSSDYYSVKRLKRESDIPDYPTPSLLSATSSILSNTTDTNGHHQRVPVLTHKLMQLLDDLVNENQTIKAELENYRDQSSSRQLQFEELNELISEKILQINEMESKVKSADHKVDRSTSDLAKVNDKVIRLTEELQEAKQLIESSDVPEKKTLYDQGTQITSLTMEVRKLEERLASRDAENEYMRSEYQKASGAAVEAHGRIGELEKEKRKLEKKLESEAVRLRLLTFDEERSQKDELIKELTNKVDMFEAHMKRLLASEKYNNSGSSRSRYTSRASSVPRRTRSPGAATLGVGGSTSGNESPVTIQNGSEPTTTAPVLTGHPLQQSHVV